MNLSKAYDCLPHDLLIAKLEAYGFSHDSLQLVCSYLESRYHTHRKKVAYEEPFTVLEQDTYMEPLKVLQRTPSQGFFKEPLPMVLQRTPKGTSENP